MEKAAKDCPTTEKPDLAMRASDKGFGSRRPHVLKISPYVVLCVDLGCPQFALPRRANLYDRSFAHNAKTGRVRLRVLEPKAIIREKTFDNVCNSINI